MGPEDRVTGLIGDAFDLDGVDDEITFANPITGTTPPHDLGVGEPARDRYV